MTYTPLNTGVAPYRKKGIQTFGASSGLNLETFSQLLDAKFSQVCSNLFPTAEGALVKREGMTKLLEIAGEEPITMLEGFHDHVVFAYGTTVASIYVPTLAVTYHKTDFDTSEPFTGFAEGDYFFFCNGSTVVQYLTFTPGSDELIDTSAWSNDQAAEWTFLVPENQVLIDRNFSTPKYIWYYTRDASAGWNDNDVITDGTDSVEILGTPTDYGDGYLKIIVDKTTWAGGETALTSPITNSTTGATATLNGSPDNTTALFEASQSIDLEVGEKYQISYTVSGATTGNLFFTGIDGISTTMERSTTSTFTQTSIYDGAFDMTVSFNNTSDANIKITSFSVKKLDQTVLTSGSLSSSPRAKVLKSNGGRMFAGNIFGDSGQLYYSDLDDGTNPPYQTWATGTSSAVGAIVNYRLGAINDIMFNGDQCNIIYDKGRAGFRIVLSADQTTKTEQMDFREDDFGGYKALQTSQGTFFTYNDGIWFSESGSLTSAGYNILENLGDLSDYDFSNSDMIYYPKEKSVLCACKYGDANGNNRIICFNTVSKAISTIDGWYTSRIFSDGDTVYGGDSTKTAIYKLFDGTYTDDGEAIGFEYEQELNVGSLDTLKDLVDTMIQADLGSGCEVAVTYDTYDRTGTKTIAKAGGTLDSNFEGGKITIKNFQRIILNLTEQSEVSCKINYVKMTVREKGQARNRGLTVGLSFLLESEAGDTITTEGGDTLIT